MAEGGEKVKYTDIVAEIMESDKYYKDALDWYCIRYYNMIAEKTLFVLLSIFSVIIILLLYSTINNIMPLREAFPVYKVQKDVVRYRTKVESLKPKNIEYTSSEAVLRMLLIFYTKEMFTHNYKDGDINALNQKLSVIRLYSSNEVFDEYRKMFNVISGELFNKNIEQKAFLTNFRLIKKSSNNKGGFVDKIMDYFWTKVPAEAEITAVVETTVGGALRQTTTRRILFSFVYEQVKYNSITKIFTKPKLIISNYRVLEEVVKNEENT